MSEWTYYVQPENPPDNYTTQQDPEDIPFTKDIRNTMVKEPTSVRSDNPLKAKTDGRRWC